MLTTQNNRVCAPLIAMAITIATATTFIITSAPLAGAMRVDPHKWVIAPNEENKLDLVEGVSQRLSALPGHVRVFALQEHTLEKNQRYDVKVSWLGSDGIDMKVFWLNPKIETNGTVVFEPHDTEKLHFATNGDGQVEECYLANKQYYRVGVVGYRNSHGVTREDQDREFEYIIKLEKVVIVGMPPYMLKQIGATFGVLAVIIAYHFLSKKWRGGSQKRQY